MQHMCQYLHTQKPYFTENHKLHLHSVAVYTGGCKRSQLQRGVRPGEDQNTVERVVPAKLRGCGRTPCSISRRRSRKKELKYIRNNLKLTPQKQECLSSYLHIQVVQVVCKHVSSGC